MLQRQLAAIRERSDVRREREGSYFRGIQVEFESFPEVALAVDRLARESSGIELLNVRYEETQDATRSAAPAGRTFATVFIPDGKLGQFDKAIEAYLAEKKDALGRPRDNRRLLDAIQAIRMATLRSLWTAAPDRFPHDENREVWWEAWLLTSREPLAVLARAHKRASTAGISVADGVVRFPERSVVLLKASVAQLGAASALVSEIAELRAPAETAEVFDSMTPNEQSDWMQELLQRTQFETSDDVPHVCLLDTGVNRGHNLIGPALSVADLHTIDPGWGTDDHAGHGTPMAGLALFGDLASILTSSDPIHVYHRLESVKILPLSGTSRGDPELHGHLTSEAVSRPEITAPTRSRVFSMSVSARDPGALGRPSAWSATIDRLAAGADHATSQPRLFLLSSGKSTSPADDDSYPDVLDIARIQDPGQAWNTLTVGAYTERDHIPHGQAPGAKAIAPRGALSPFTMTSVSWQRAWPTKPDVVFEGGNRAQDSLSAFTMPGLGLLTTNYRPADRLFTTATGTSPAAALAARMAARIVAEYPDYWPETVRGLIVHSAEWTSNMRSMHLPNGNAATKADYGLLLRRCGFGVPNMDAALWSASNSLSIVTQEEIGASRFRVETGRSRAEIQSAQVEVDRLPEAGAVVLGSGGWGGERVVLCWRDDVHR